MRIPPFMSLPTHVKPFIALIFLGESCFNVGNLHIHLSKIISVHPCLALGWCFVSEFAPPLG